MDDRGTQLHREIIHRREAIDDKLAQVERRVQQMAHGARSTAIDVIDHGLIAGVQRARETRGRAVALVVWYPWLIIAAGALLGYIFGRPDGTQRLHATSGGVRAYEAVLGCPPVTRP
jgi:hypothetical protein